jgi:hypothetical protein
MLICHQYTDIGVWMFLEVREKRRDMEKVMGLKTRESYGMIHRMPSRGASSSTKYGLRDSQ